MIFLINSQEQNSSINSPPNQAGSIEWPIVQNRIILDAPLGIWVSFTTTQQGMFVCKNKVKSLSYHLINYLQL